MWTAEAGLTVRCRPRWAVRTFYSREESIARLGALVRTASEPGSYRVNQAGAEVTWSSDLWRSRGRPRSGSEGGEP